MGTNPFGDWDGEPDLPQFSIFNDKVFINLDRFYTGDPQLPAEYLHWQLRGKHSRVGNTPRGSTHIEYSAPGVTYEQAKEVFDYIIFYYDHVASN
jgi:hypothetical protein